MDFDIQSFGLFIIIILLTIFLEQDRKLDKYLPKNKVFYIIIFSLIGGLLVGITSYYNFNLTQSQNFLVFLVIFRLMNTLMIKTQR